MTLRRTAAACLITLCLASTLAAAQAVSWKQGRLAYETDERGNRVPDFSHAGYRGGDVPIPHVEASVVVIANADDMTAAIQAAIDEVSKRPADAEGFRGAVLLPPGTLNVSGSILIHTSGVVLRGSGADERGTTLRATGLDRRTVIQLRGRPIATGKQRAVTNAYVPVNETRVDVEDVGDFREGGLIRLSHPSTKEWIAALGMNDFGGDRHGPSWRPGSRDIHWLRRIENIDGNTLTLDAPITLALDASLGRCVVAPAEAEGLIERVGVENLRIVSTFDHGNAKDEAHAWFGVGIEHARDAWVRRVTCAHLAGSAVAVWETASRVTVEECKNIAPVGEVGGLRRRAFFTAGQQVLMQRLYAEAGVNDFAVGLAAAGPNAFVQCESVGSLSESGAIDSAACGTLFDRVRIDGHALSLRNRGYAGQGVGWASFNGVLWNATASVIRNEKPPMAQNWSFGAHGEFDGDGSWSGSDDDVDPPSLYYAQLAERVGRDAAARAHLNLPPVQGSRAPTLEEAAEAIKVSMTPRVTMSEWIDEIAQRDPIAITSGTLPSVPVPTREDVVAQSQKLLTIKNGWIMIDGRVAVGGEQSVPWWRGGLREDDRSKAEPALTRFVPGREGAGLTDRVDELAEVMKANGNVSLWQHPPLWYERRRDDHSRVSRMDAEVVGPFYETPWPRSGKAFAADGLSRWDLTKTNPWYFGRLRQFADVGAERGLILFNGLYMQHSVLEAGAHYADFPWRSANNINPVGLPEPVFFAGDKLIYVAEQFYDVENNDRAALHRTYMRNVLNELADKPNVILFLSEEYTGPVAFVRFWLDTVAEWEKETGKEVKVALYATKDATDAILADPERASVITLVYNRFNNEGDAGWWYQPDGSLYAPEAGRNLAPRQWARLLKPKRAEFLQVHRAVREYRLAHPEKPFVYQGPDTLAWAVLLGGGSLAPVPATTDPQLLQAIGAMSPIKEGIGLRDEAGNALVFAPAIPEGLDVVQIDTQSGTVLPQPAGGEGVYWIRVQP